MDILIAPFVNALFGAHFLVGNLGWSIVLVTVLIRLLLLPLVVPSLKSAEKMRELQPRLKKLQEKYKGEKEKLAKAQMDFYKEEGVNPLSGCLPQILQIAVLIIFFSAFNKVAAFSEGKSSVEAVNQWLIPALKVGNDFKFGLDFLGVELSKTPAGIFKGGIGVGLIVPGILLLGSGVLQYFSSKLMMPADAKAVAGKPAVKVDQSAYVKATEDKGDDMMEAMRTQSLYMMPAMTVFIGWNFSIGILLYWFVNSAVMLVQQIVIGKMDSSK